MANTTWTNTGEEVLFPAKNNRVKFVVGGVLLLSAIVYLIVTAMSGNTQLYKTVGEFYAEQDQLIGRDLRVVGYVIGDSIEFTQIDATTTRLEFDIVDDINNPGQKLRVVAMNEPRPDTLLHRAEALVEGSANENGELILNQGGLLTKCASRYEEVDAASYQGS